MGKPKEFFMPKGKILMGKTPKPDMAKPAPGKKPVTRGPVNPGKPKKTLFPGSNQGGKQGAPVAQQNVVAQKKKLLGTYESKIGNSIAPKVQISGLLGRMTPGRASIYKGTDKRAGAAVKVKATSTKPVVYGNSNVKPTPKKRMTDR